MNPAETVILARYVRALCPQQKFDEYTPDAWHGILAGYDLDDARSAVANHVTAGNSFVSVAEIITGIKAIRLRRIEAANPLYDGTPDEDGQQSAENIRALVGAAADGRLRNRTIRGALESGEPPAITGRAKAMLEAVGQRVPSPRAGVVNVLGIACPACWSPAGKTCSSRRGRSRADVHPARLEDARRLAAGQPPVDRTEIEAERQQRLQAARRVLEIEGPTAFVPPTRAEIEAAKAEADEAS